MSTTFVLQMQLGFAFLENGLVSKKNSKNILIKNLFDVCVGTLSFWLFGYGIAFGYNSASEETRFIKVNMGMFASSEFSSIERNSYLMWVF